MNFLAGIEHSDILVTSSQVQGSTDTLSSLDRCSKVDVRLIFIVDTDIFQMVGYSTC